MESAIPFFFQIAVLVFSIVIHEVMHGFAANALGDPTARYAGRLTLNPIPHLDPVGSLLVPFLTFVLPTMLGGSGIIIGWARPVPYNPNFFRMRNRELGSALVGFAGPGANIAIAVFFGLGIRAVLSGFAPGAASDLIAIMGAIAITNLFLAAFNLVPIPPLDGSKVLFWLLPPRAEPVRIFLERYGFFLLLAFLFSFAGAIAPIVSFFFRLLAGIS